MRGDLTGAEAELAQAARRAEQLGFPQGPFMHAYTRFAEIWVRIEAGQLDRAAVLAADLTSWPSGTASTCGGWWGATEQATVSALAALGADDPDPAALAAHIATMTTFLDTWRTLELNTYLTFFDAIVGAAVDRRRPTRGRPAPPGHRTGSWPRTPGCASTTPNCSGCAPTPTPTPTPAKPTSPPPSNWPAARARPSSNCAPPSMISTCAAQPARAALTDAASRIPADSPLPELARARAILDRIAHGFE